MITGLLTPSHVVILLIVVLVILGPRRLPQAGRALGRSMREFKEGITGHGTDGTEADLAPQPLETTTLTAAPRSENQP